MATRYLKDTSAAIKYLNHSLPVNGLSFIDNFIDTNCTISFISEIELQVWNPVTPDDVIIYEQFVLQSEVIGISQEIIAETIAIRKIYRLKIADAIIAATALQLDFTLVADNDKDFKRVPGLKYINPGKIK